MRMLEDCEAGEIDIICTKSISRFARNTVECIKIVRELKKKQIDVYFEKENIHTLSEKSEFLIFWHIIFSPLNDYFPIYDLSSKSLSFSDEKSQMCAA